MRPRERERVGEGVEREGLMIDECNKKRGKTCDAKDGTKLRTLVFME